MVVTQSRRESEALSMQSGHTRYVARQHLLLILYALIGLASVACGQDSGHPSDASQLSKLGIELTPEGVAEYFDSLLAGTGRVSDQAADQLIAELGSDNFTVREQAADRLAAMQAPPIEKLKQASTQKRDLEVAVRAKAVLARVEQRADPRVSVFRQIESQRIEVDLKQMLEVIAACESHAVIEAALDAFAAAVGNEDADLIRRSLKDDRVLVQAAAIRALPEIEDDKKLLIGQLHKWLGQEEAILRIAAVRSLVELGASLDAEEYADLLDTHTMVVVLRAEEKRFRQQHKDQRNDRDVRTKHQVLLTRYADVLAKSKQVTRKQHAASRSREWINQGLDTSKYPDVLMYRIRWFSGSWSGWFVPGFNDREKGKGRDIRHWGCFADHTHEIIRTTDQRLYREIHDLP